MQCGAPAAVAMTMARDLSMHVVLYRCCSLRGLDSSHRQSRRRGAKRRAGRCTPKTARQNGKYDMVLEATSPCHARSAEGATIAAVAECTALVGLHGLGGVSAVRLWRRTLRTRGSALARALHSAACCGDRSLLGRLDLRSQRRVSHPNQHTRQTFAEDAAQERDQRNPREDARYSYHWRVV
jgi:hypothetical protein